MLLFSFLWLSFLGFAICGPQSPGGGGLQPHGDDFVPDHVLRITREPYSIGCGVVRDTYLVNGSTPGPEIRLQPGKISWIRVYNDVPDANLTMHWHGLSQRVAPFSDGTPQVSQWPIPPLHFFDYEIFPGDLDAGTYFYHSHVNFQAVSVTGPLIVEDKDGWPSELYGYDEEKVVLVTDYFNKTDANITEGLLNVPFQWSGETNAVLLNGKGVPNFVQQQNSSCALPTFDLTPGKTYRFRFIGGTALSLVGMRIQDHENFTVIAADARYTKPQSIDHIQIGTGQRFDILIHAKTQSELQALGRDTFIMQMETKNRPAVYTGFAVFRYNTDTVIDYTPSVSLPSPNNTYDYLEYTLEPVYPNDFPTADEVTRRVYMTVQQAGSPSANIRWYENRLNWTEAAEMRPLLVDIYQQGQAAVPNYTLAMENDGWDPVFKAWPAKIGEVLEIIIQNTGSEVNNNGGLDIHPFHAHAGHFYDIGAGNGTYDPVANEQRLAGYSPVLRDTTYLYKYASSTGAGQVASWRGWRIRVADAGAYLIHCHILQHMIMGMQTAWVFGDADQIKRVPHDMAEGYMTYGGSAYGNRSVDPLAYHYYEQNPEQPWM